MISLAGKVTVGLVESNGSLPPGLWLMSSVGWLPRNWDQLRNRVWNYFTFSCNIRDSHQYRCSEHAECICSAYDHSSITASSASRLLAIAVHGWYIGDRWRSEDAWRSKQLYDNDDQSIDRSINQSINQSRIQPNGSLNQRLLQWSLLHGSN